MNLKNYELQTHHYSRGYLHEAWVRIGHFNKRKLLGLNQSERKVQRPISNSRTQGQTVSWNLFNPHPPKKTLGICICLCLYNDERKEQFPLRIPNSKLTFLWVQNLNLYYLYSLKDLQTKFQSGPKLAILTGPWHKQTLTLSRKMHSELGISRISNR